MRKDRALHTQVRQKMDSIRTPNNVEYFCKQKKDILLFFRKLLNRAHTAAETKLKYDRLLQNNRRHSPQFSSHSYKKTT